MLNLIITNAGRAAIVNAANTGTAPVTVTQVGVSAGALAPNAGMTNLPGEIKRLATISGLVVADDTIHLVVRDESADAYSLRSFALYLGDGTLFGIYGQASAIVEKTAQSIALIQMDVKFADIAATSITFGNMEFVNPPATTSVQGVVELATDAEAAARLDAQRAVTPKNLDQFVLRSGDAMSGTINGVNEPIRACGTSPYYSFYNAPRSVRFGYLQSGGTSGSMILVNEVAGGSITLFTGLGAASAALTADGYFSATAFRAAGNTVWHAGNDGSGSGLDADTLDGFDGSEFARIAGAKFTGTVYGPSHAFAACGPQPYLSFFNAAATVRFGYIQHTGANGIFTLNNEQNGPISFVTNNVAAGLSPIGMFSIVGGNDEKLRFAATAPYISGYNANQSARYGYLQFTPSTTILAHDTGALTLVIAGTTVGVANAAGFGVAGTLTVNGQTAWHAGNDGAGSGLDADTLDGADGSQFARIAGASFDGTIGAPFLVLNPGLDQQIRMAGGAPYISAYNAALTQRHGYMQFTQSSVMLAHDTGSIAFLIAGSTKATIGASGAAFAGPVLIAGNTAWHAGNDGAGSGLDADLLDGRDSLSFANAAHSHGVGDLPASIWRSDNDGAGSGLDADLLDGRDSLSFANAAHSHGVGDLPASIWRSDNDGAGSGLDADLLDGRDSSSFANASHSHGVGDLPASIWRSDNDGSGSGLDADLLDGYDASAFVLAANLASNFQNLKSDSGYQRLPGGLILQWIYLAPQAAGVETTNVAFFPVSFPNACLHAQVSTVIPTGTNGADIIYQLVGTPSTDAAVIFRQRPSNNATDSQPTAAFVFVIGH